MPWVALMADTSDVLAAQAASIENGANMPQRSLDFHNRIDPLPTNIPGTKTENEPGKQMIYDNAVRTPAGALENCSLDEIRDRSIELMSDRPGARRARHATASERFAPKLAAGSRPGLPPLLHKLVHYLLRVGG